MPCNLIDWYGNSSFITDFFDIALHQGLFSSLLGKTCLIYKKPIIP